MTTLLYFPIGKARGGLDEAVTEWARGLPAVTWEPPPNGDEQESARSAVWRGLPFVLSGNEEVLDRYFDGLDEDSTDVLADHAYFWILAEGGEYTHKSLPNDRLVTLDPAAPTQHIVGTAIKRLERFPRIQGLSRSTDILRDNILKIANEETGPGCSVLILGPSGSGKEEVAQALAAKSGRKDTSLQAISGAWLKMEPGMAMSELLGLVRGRVEERIVGLLTQHSERTLLIDDFESAADCVQETLLRIMSVPEGSRATYRPVGGDKDLQTNVWLVFATNRDVESFARADFIYRFGARVIWILPLEERPADFPSIAQHIWASIWDRYPTDKRREPLRSSAVKHLYCGELNWDGNVRALASLLRLVTAEMRNPAMNGCSQMEIIDEITSRGPRYLDWVRSYGKRASQTPEAVTGKNSTSGLSKGAPLAGRVGVSDESGLKAKLEQVLAPRGVELVGKLEDLLMQRKRGDKPVNAPGRHLFYAALLFIAEKPDHQATSGELKEALKIGRAHVHTLCVSMTDTFRGELAELCRCEGGDQTRFRFAMIRDIFTQPA